MSKVVGSEHMDQIEELAVSCFGKERIKRICESHEQKIVKILTTGYLNMFTTLGKSDELFPDITPRARIRACVAFQEGIEKIVQGPTHTELHPEEELQSEFVSLCKEVGIIQKEIADALGTTQPRGRMILRRGVGVAQARRKQVAEIFRARAEKEGVSLEGYDALMRYLENSLSS